MSAADISSQALEPFAALAENPHLTFLLGAGASAPSGLPSWDELAIRLATASGLVRQEKYAQILMSREDPSIVLQAIQARSGPNWGELLHSALYGTTPQTFEPSPLHLAVAEHYLEHPHHTTLATLNFDVLLETAMQSAGIPLVFAGIDEIEEPLAPTVHHLHGAVFEGSAYSPVVGYQDFANLVAEQSPWQLDFLKRALLRGPLLIAGSSFRDPDIRHWLHVIMRDNELEHRPLVTVVREGLGVDRRTFAAIQDALIAEWESIGITAVTMEDFSDIAFIVRELQHLARPNYRAPRDRAHALWSALRTHFTPLQDEFTRSLTKDAEHVAKTLNLNVQRATLWIANGRGKLARWSTAGTTYNKTTDLKLVPIGHDSPWIAGESIASEEVKIKATKRAPGIHPHWRSVLAIPLIIGDRETPMFAAAVITFGLSQPASKLLERQSEWTEMAAVVAARWGSRLSTVAFGP